MRRFHDSGYGFAVLERLRVAGGMRRAADRCPVCHSTARERLVWFWLSGADGHGVRVANGARIAHFAPEKGLSRRLRALLGVTYRAFDVEPGRYRHLPLVEFADLSDLPLADASIDLLVCNHVIEHVPDPARGLREIRRVLAPGATAILQVPIALAATATIEAPAEATSAEREALLGQHDHLRLYDRAGYVAALEAAGLRVDCHDAFAQADAAATAWRLDPLEILFVCSPA
ncbi:MAG: class I SAM-dependent methyltransferase [Novosphingobium sp.]